MSSVEDGTGTIIVEAHGRLPRAAGFLYCQRRSWRAQVGSERIEQVVQLTIKVIQGDAKTIELWIHGRGGQVTEVQDASSSIVVHSPSWL